MTDVPERDDEKPNEYVYPDLQGVEEQRRAYIFERLTEASDSFPFASGSSAAEFMSQIEKWLIDGSVPKQEKPGKTAKVSHLKEVDKP